MLEKDIYKIWAPENLKWAAWVRPVPFIGLGKVKKTFNNYDIQNIDFSKFVLENSAIFIDLPADYSVAYGVKLTDYDYWPIPIFNGTIAQKNSISTTDNEKAQLALLWGADKLKEKIVCSNYKPAFLLESSRTNTYKMDQSVFDNSWDIYSQDIPSKEYFIENDINKIIIIGEKIQRDLKKIFLKFQKAGIDIYFCDLEKEPKKIKLIRDLKSFFIKDLD